jgi:hypothetical protein
MVEVSEKEPAERDRLKELSEVGKRASESRRRKKA